RPSAVSRTTCLAISGYSLQTLVWPDREIGGMKRMRLHKRQHNPVNDRPQRLHQTEDERTPFHIVCVKKTDCRVEPVGGNLHPYLTFEHCVGVVQDRVDKMCCISIRANSVLPRRARADLMPVIWN